MNKASFQFVHPEELPRLVELEQLDHVTVCQNLPVSARRSGHKTGCESWKCAWAPDRSYLAWSAGHSLVHLLPWDVEKQKKHNPNHMDGLQGRNYHVIDTGELVHSVAFGITSNTVKKQRWMYQNLTSTVVLATGHKSGRIKLWNCETGSLLLELIDHKDVVRDMHFATDDSLRLVSASLDGYIKLWEFDEKGDCNLYRSLKSNTKHVFGCRWSPNMKFIAAVGSTKVVLLFSVEGRDCPKQMASGRGHTMMS
ncbi:hypothetical protein C0Q70_06955 [Pomacea canaliculata]|uniref:Uncharacterized protein n=1 Tax=Pomacea canaliculata TaxID=400727 RepID=A0A2T7PDP5_POMCA|nr:WD repeat and SOCS box-containing protein 1-like [Pomacea canaliculata]PVD31542.1 hypothetical protein C0Q70_06955 [Pomacea canaliculata]